MEAPTNSLTLLFQGKNNESTAVVSLIFTYEEYDEDAHRRFEKSVSQSMYFCGLSDYDLELPEATLTVTKVKGDGLKFSHTTEDGDVITFGNPFLAIRRHIE